jgi:hypothetical protein
MNGADHALAEPQVAAAAAALAGRTGWTVVRGLLEDFAAALPPDAPRLRGELLGARVANLLPGVWSTRTPLKLRNRRAEALLEGWAEPFAALAAALGAADERPALRSAWRALLQNQAHDSICGCSLDRVHTQMAARYDTATELGRETAARALERLAGLGPERRSPWGETFEVAVFNPSPRPRTDVVRLDLAPDRWLQFRTASGRGIALHPWLRPGAAQGYLADGQPARVRAERGADRVQPARSVEFVVTDVPALGWKRVGLAPAEPSPGTVDTGREIAGGTITVRAADDGTLAIRLGDRSYDGLLGLEDVGDRGDTYDSDPVAEGEVTLERVSIGRRLDPTGIGRLRIRRTLAVPAALAADRLRRSVERTRLTLDVEVRLVPGTERADLRVRLRNRARDHRLRLLFPTGAPAETFLAATTSDVARRRTAPPDASRWVHPAPATFPHQGFVAVNGLAVAAPGLPEAEVTPDGVIAVTLVRAVGWLARADLTTRPQVAGPLVAVPGAQCRGRIEARLSLFAEHDGWKARDAELGLWAVAAGETPLVAAGRPLVEVEPATVLLSALKPAADGGGLVLRLLNPTDAPISTRVRVGFRVSRAFPVALDETPRGEPLCLDSGGLTVTLAPHALWSVRLA